MSTAGIRRRYHAIEILVPKGKHIPYVLVRAIRNAGRVLIGGLRRPPRDADGLLEQDDSMLLLVRGSASPHD